MGLQSRLTADVRLLAPLGLYSIYALTPPACSLFAPMAGPGERGRVLVIVAYREIADVVYAILTDAGFQVLANFSVALN